MICCRIRSAQLPASVPACWPVFPKWLGQVGDAIHAARHTDDALPFAQWKRRLDRRLQNGRQSSALAVAITGWVLAGCFGIAAIVMWALAAVGPEALGVTREEFLVFLILMACFTLMTVGFGIMGGIGVRAVPLFQPAAPVSSGGSGLGL